MQRKSSNSVQIFYPKFDQKELTQTIKRQVKELEEKLPLSLVVLFGSYARGNFTVASDIDLLVVYKGKRREDVFATVKKTIDVPLLEPHVYQEDEYEKIKDAFKRIIENGIVLWDRKSSEDEV